MFHVAVSFLFLNLIIIIMASSDCLFFLFLAPFRDKDEVLRLITMTRLLSQESGGNKGS